jgi:hypothetical protein
MPGLPDLPPAQAEALAAALGWGPAGSPGDRYLVAAALFLNPKMVEHHLASVFRKRGVRSRTELAAAFAWELSSSSRG